MRSRSAAKTAVMVVLAGIPATSCAGEPRCMLGTAMEQLAAQDWELLYVADTNGDGLADLIWWSPSARAIEVWLMTGTHVLARGAPILGPSGEGWEPVVSVDFNHDGLSDLVWTNPAHGTTLVWLLDGTRLLEAGPEIHGPAGDGWVAAAAGDVNGDGLADVAWYDAAKQRVAVWLMNGVHVLSPGPELPGPRHGERVLDGLGDLNGDRMADMVWTQPATHTMEVWLMAGTRQLVPGRDDPGPLGEGWRAVTLTDFNVDGLEDVLWGNASRGSMAIWLMAGNQILEAGPEIAGPPGEGWSVAYANDMNGDRIADTAWQKKGTSWFTVWLMNGTQVLERGPILPGPTELGAGP